MQLKRWPLCSQPRPPPPPPPQPPPTPAQTGAAFPSRVGATRGLLAKLLAQRGNVGIGVGFYRLAA